MGLNKILLIGNLGKNPEVRVLNSGVKVATFTLATTERGYTLQNGTQVPDKTQWHNIVVWRGLADVAEKYLHKGDKVYIEGKVEYRNYDDNNGVRRDVTDIHASNLEMLSAPKQPSQPAPEPPQADMFPPAPNGEQDDLPF